MVPNGNLMQRLVDQWIHEEDPKIRQGEGRQDSSLALQTSGQSARGVGRSGASAPQKLLGCQMSKYPTGYNNSFTTPKPS